MNTTKVIAIVGMAGSGKSEVARILAENGFARIRFGDVTDEEIARRNLELNEKNERRIRELLREEQGMAAYAEINLPKIDSALKKSDVVIDGLYSWEEYTFLKEYYDKNLFVIAVWSSPKTRYTRLSSRLNRSLNTQEAASRDKEEIENIGKGGPIAMADITVINESSLDDLRKEVQEIIAKIK